MPVIGPGSHPLVASFGDEAGAEEVETLTSERCLLRNRDLLLRARTPCGGHSSDGNLWLEAVGGLRLAQIVPFQGNVPAA